MFDFCDIDSSTGDRSPAPTEIDSCSDSDAGQNCAGGSSCAVCVHDSDSEAEKLQAPIQCGLKIEQPSMPDASFDDYKDWSASNVVKDCSNLHELPSLISCAKGSSISYNYSSQWSTICAGACSNEEDSVASTGLSESLQNFDCTEHVLQDSTNVSNVEISSNLRRKQTHDSLTSQKPCSQLPHSLEEIVDAAHKASRKGTVSKPPRPARKAKPPQGSAPKRLLSYEEQHDESRPPRQLSKPRAGMIELRHERRQREAQFRLGELQAKPPIVHFDSAGRSDWFPLEVQRGSQIGATSPSLQVLFPLSATHPQSILSANAIEALDRNGCALLESPTGTGKTLAALASALAWQWSEISSAETTRPPADTSTTTPQPRVIWVARTHEQLLHTVHEFRRLPYRPVMSLRLSRERFCLHPNVRTARNKAEACELATTIAPNRARRGPRPGNKGQPPQPTGCSYLEHAEAVRYPQAPRHRRRFELGGPLAVYDIEDLVKEAEALHICPFHAVGDLAMEGAGLILMTYNQMLDPLVRFAGGYEPLFEGAVVIVDEAHNLPSEARDVASFVATAEELEAMRRHFADISLQLPGDKFPKIARRLVEAVSKLKDWLLASISRGVTEIGEIRLRACEFGEKGTYAAGGSECLALVKHCGLESATLIDRDLRDLKLLRKDLIWAGLESTAVRSSGVNELEAFLWKMRFVLSGSDDYRLVVEPGPRVHFICLRGAVALGPAVKQARSLLLMSGTLSPFDVITHELGLDANSKASAWSRHVLSCQAPHHARLQNMCTACAISSVHNVALDSRLKQRSMMYLDAIGFAVKNVSEVVPNGTVVFLPSYSLLDSLITRLQATGCFAALQTGRQVFLEQRGEAGNIILANYRTAARVGPALLFAVMRGKAAEGIDLRDSEARCCLVVGVPFPSLAIDVQLRRQAPGGNRWFVAEAMRQVSQAAGRLLRHQDDFGAVVLLDVRFTERGKLLALLAPWLRSLLQNTSLETACSSLKSFFSTHVQAQQPWQEPRHA